MILLDELPIAINVPLTFIWVPGANFTTTPSSISRVLFFATVIKAET